MDATTELHFPREMEPMDYLMFRGEQDPRSRSAMMSVAMLDRVPDFGRLRTAFERASRTALRLRQHVKVPALGLGTPLWITDPDFDIDYHVRRIALPAPGTRRQLLDMAQTVLAAPFDTARPLWEAHLVEGLTEDGCPAALLMKLNHAVTDGVGGVEMYRQIYDVKRNQKRGPMPPVPVPEDVTEATLARSALRHLPAELVASAGRNVERTLRFGRRFLDDPSRAVDDVGKLAGSARRVLSPPPVEPSPLLRRRGLGRRLESIEFPLDGFRRAAKAAGGSVNDAFIAAICGAMRHYHDAMGMPVDAVPLAMPVNLRTDDDPAGGNRFAGARIVAPVGEPDAAKRIQAVRSQVLSAVGEPAINAMSVAAPALSRLPSSMLGALAGLTSSTDVQASNVAGFPESPFIAGAKVVRTLPFGPLPGVPMMIILVTEGGMCYVGVHYDTASITDAEVFLASLRAGFDEVHALDPKAGT